MAKAPVFYLGTHMEGWLAHIGVPLFVSHRRAGAPQDAAQGPFGLGAGLRGVFRAVALRWLADDTGGVRV
jgi:hypothetical protein